MIAPKEKPTIGDMRGATIMAPMIAGALLLSRPNAAIAVAMPNMK